MLKDLVQESWDRKQKSEGQLVTKLLVSILKGMLMKNKSSTSFGG